MKVPLLRNPSPILTSNGLPPIPGRLIQRVEDSMHIEIAELLPDYLSTAEVNISEQPSSSRSKLHKITNTMDWVECFGMYIAIISRSGSLTLLPYHICLSKLP